MPLFLKTPLKRGTLFFLIVCLLAALTPSMAPAAQGEKPAPFEVRVMTFNIWVGGELVDFGKVIEAIQAAKADVVGLQEAGGNIRRIAEALGWQHVNERLAVISRYPLIDLKSGKGNAIFVQVRPGQVFAMANTHLPSDPYGPYLVRDGESLENVLRNEADTRMGTLTPLLDGLSEVVKADMPLVLTGDFNSPSHLDWTEAGVKNRGYKAYPVQWPVTVALAQAGFKDTYRAAHPDPVAKPGNTWTYGYPHPRLRENEAIDRIDLVFAAGPVEVLNSQIVGPENTPDVDVPVTPYPSDHRAVVSTLRVTPVVPPLFVSFDRRRIVAGEPFVVRYHAPEGENADKIMIVPAGADALAAGIMSLPPYEADFFGSVTFGSGALKPGAYDAVLLNKDGMEVARNSAWVVAPNAPVTIRTDKATYRERENIIVTWENTPGNRADWVGIYRADEVDGYNYIGYIYTAGEVNGTGTFDAAVLGDLMLEPGEYTAQLMLDDGYATLASVSFKVGR